MITCRDMLRVGQLMLNKGKWRKDSEPFQLVNESYVSQLAWPSYPNAASNYGFLTWLNLPAAKVGTTCCAPRWGYENGCNEGYEMSGSIIGDDLKDLGAPWTLQMAIGWLGKYIMVLPDRNITVVSVGNTWGSSKKCDVCKSINYDEAFTARRRCGAPSLHLSIARQQSVLKILLA